MHTSSDLYPIPLCQFLIENISFFFFFNFHKNNAWKILQSHRKSFNLIYKISHQLEWVKSIDSTVSVHLSLPLVLSHVMSFVAALALSVLVLASLWASRGSSQSLSSREVVLSDSLGHVSWRCWLTSCSRPNINH